MRRRGVLVGKIRRFVIAYLPDYTESNAVQQYYEWLMASATV